MYWFRAGVITVMITSITPLALAQEQDFTNDFLACADIENPPLRYACFDETSAKVKTLRSTLAPIDQDQTSAEPKPAMKLAEPKEKSGKRLFGLLPKRKPVTDKKDFGIQPKPAPNTEITAINGSIKTFEVDHYGKVTVELQDGQIWRQITGDSTRMTKAKMKRQSTAVIKKAAVGSFLMTLQPAETAIRVKRLK